MPALSVMPLLIYYSCLLAMIDAKTTFFSLGSGLKLEQHEPDQLLQTLQFRFYLAERDCNCEFLVEQLF